MNHDEIISTVENLNQELYDRFRETENGFTYTTDGNEGSIRFSNTLIWSSEMDDREWLEDKNDYEPFEPFIRRIFNEWVGRIYPMKLLEGGTE